MNDPGRILDLIEGFRVSKTLFAAVELGVFDGVRPPGPAAARLLDACVALELLAKRGAAYVNTPLADEYLRSDGPATLAAYVRFTNRSLYPRWAHLEDAVLAGSRGAVAGAATVSRVFAALRRRMPRVASWLRARVSRLVAPAQLEREFVAGMHGWGQLTSPHVVRAFDLSRFTKLVDLGGSSGHLALAALERYPSLRVCVYDLRAVIELTPAFTGARAELIAGDFFVDPLPPADLYALAKVLHNLGPHQARALLARIHASLAAGGGLLIAERLLDEDGLGPRHALLSSLNMLVATDGRERTFSDYRSLLEGAGFGEIQCRTTGGLLDVILALK